MIEIRIKKSDNLQKLVNSFKDRNLEVINEVNENEKLKEVLKIYQECLVFFLNQHSFSDFPLVWC